MEIQSDKLFIVYETLCLKGVFGKTYFPIAILVKWKGLVSLKDR